ncbi:MAG: type II secretion system protein [Planctomycetota bacterium]|nr:MAG: type II secretion system protein [Planctomycetota bacterium]
MIVRAFTLVEAIVTTVILSIIAAIVLPVLNGAADSFGASSQAERVVDDSTYAINRVIRLLREAPQGGSPGTIGVTSLSSSSVVFTDQSGCRLSGGRLEIRPAGGTWGTLCDDVEAFELRALDSTGADSSASPEQTQRFEVRLLRGGLELRASAFCRSRYGT